jgi:hypothetical protein
MIWADSSDKNQLVSTCLKAVVPYLNPSLCYYFKCLHQCRFDYQNLLQTYLIYKIQRSHLSAERCFVFSAWIFECLVFTFLTLTIQAHLKYAVTQLEGLFMMIEDLVMVFVKDQYNFYLLQVHLYTTLHFKCLN